MTDQPQPQARRTRAPGQRSRARVVEQAAKLATIEGLEGLSLGRLADATGLPKSSVHALFGSKEELQLATVDTALEIFASEVMEPAQTIADPLARLQAVCDRFLSHVERGVFPGGCFFASVSAEFDTHPGPVKDKIAVVQQRWSATLEQLIEEAQANGQLSRNEDAAQLAFEVDAYLLMGNTAFLLHNDPSSLHRARTAIAHRLSRAA